MTVLIRFLQFCFFAAIAMIFMGAMKMHTDKVDQRRRGEWLLYGGFTLLVGSLLVFFGVVFR